ncbi:MAG: YbaB/EbfC family nucleoid-associated protein [Desulfobulbaceae bacterium]|jgi:DNA-binding YbaB/EbfC family protein|nr:YbaB/EbfC family nucleoid-associated protein [Desulfobulbaceae bacterium]
MDMSELMKHARQFQERLGDIQQELGSRTVTGSAGGGMVTATLNGRLELIDLHIEAQVVNPGDVSMLQDLVIAAVNDGLIKARQLAQSELGKLTGGMNIPGLF